MNINHTGTIGHNRKHNDFYCASYVPYVPVVVKKRLL